MTRARKPQRATRAPHAGFAGDMSRMAAAVVLLAIVGLLTLNGVTSTKTDVQQSRLRDRVDLAGAFASPLQDWLRAAQAAATTLASGAKATDLTGWDTLRVAANGVFTGTSGRYVAQSAPAQAHPCATGAGLADLVGAATRAGHAVAAVLNPPGTCDDPVVGVAAPATGGAVVITTDLNALMAQTPVAAHLKSGLNAYLVDSLGTRLVLGQGPEPAPAYLATFSAQVASGKATSIRTTGSDGHTKVVDAGAAVDGGWAFVVEQAASSFDVGTKITVPHWAVVLVGGLFAILLLLQAVSDLRRRDALRYADAHTAAFLAVLGHELRTPLTVIRGFVDTLSTRWDSLTDPQRHDLVDRLPQQNRRLTRVVERLLLAANLQAGSATRPTVAPVNIAQALERAADEFRPMAPLHEFVVVSPRDLAARADARALDHILDQLVDNAVRYSPSGGLVRLGAVRRRGHVEISVEDEGIGLPKDTRNIFQAFAQGESTDQRVHDEGGVGVGLYITRKLCEQLGGSVRAERVARGGARFVVTLRPARVRERLTV
ncbi:MAG: HAMP domain-containing histidine kinase [Actinobacteria bacterium]|nr:HAMP domain-containing histidine kinase [Actinomycetota bacterium]